MLIKKKIGQYGNYTVYQVNGEEVRDSSLNAEEFNESAIHVDNPTLVPIDELWVEDNLSREEIPFVIADLLWREKLMLGGMSKEDAYNRALTYEKQMRSNFHPKQIGDIRVKQIGLYNSVSIWLVNGFLVRNRFKTDFVDGGNHSRYPWIPVNELWVEKSLHSDEYKFIAAHEYIEEQLMAHNGWKYERAHQLASKIEYKLRDHKDVMLNNAIPLALEILRRMRIHA